MIELPDGLLYLGDGLDAEPIRVSGLRWEWAPSDTPPDHPFAPGPVSIELTYTLRRSMMRQIARVFGIPPHLLGAPSWAKLRRMHALYDQRRRARRRRGRR